MITTINYHLIKSCNFKCKFCYATFNDISSKGLSKKDQLKLIELLAQAQLFKKINFAGGEPTLVPHISELIKHSKLLGFETSIVTNASKINSEWIKDIAPYLDILTISVDSIEETTNILSGRNQNKKVISKNLILQIANACRLFGIEVKINTVVSKFNQSETLSAFINLIRPFRWKVLQATKVEGQNDAYFDLVKVTSKEFDDYCTRNKKSILSEIKVIIEDENLIQGSYLMIDQLGRFYDSSNKTHHYSSKILETGVQKTLKQVNLNTSKFLEREGSYSIIKQSNTVA